MPVPPIPDPASLPDHVARNLDTLADLHAVEEKRVNRHQRAIETITAALARPSTLYSIVALVIAWVIGNVLVRDVFHARPVDPPPFPGLQGVITLASLVTSTIVLIPQNRLGHIADRRSRFDLQVNLQAEQRTAKLIALVEELRRDLPNVRNRRDAEAEAMSTRADPRAVASALESLIDAPVPTPAEPVGSPDAPPDVSPGSGTPKE